MNYEKLYQSLIQKRKTNPISKEDQYCECHHLIPKSEGGTDDKDNLVNLTAREHFIAHLLLAKIYDDYKMWCALNRLVYGHDLKKYNHISSRSYSTLKQNIAIQFSKMYKGKKRPKCAQHGINNPMFGKHHSEETKAKMRARATGRRHSEETKIKMSKALKGKPSHWKGKHLSEETRKKISEANKGKVKSSEAIEKQRISISKPVVQLTLGGEFVREYLNSVEASKALGCSTTQVRNCIYGRRKTCRGFLFQFKEDYING